VSRVVAIDEYTIPYRVPDVHRVLLDTGHYALWWPAPFRFRAESSPAKIGARVEVRLGRWMRWVATVREIRVERIDLDIGEGTWAGTAHFGLREVFEGTAVLYRMDVAPQPLWLRLALQRIDARARQTRRLKPVFVALASRLEETGAERVPEPTGPNT
jgi:hypothetical protein